MTIISAKFANESSSVVELNTMESGSVIVQLEGEDISGGWRNVYLLWSQNPSNHTSVYLNGNGPVSVSDHLAKFGFDAISLVNLSDIERRVEKLGDQLPEKCSAVRFWFTACQAAYATGNQLPEAPYTLPELLPEIAQLFIE